LSLAFLWLYSRDAARSLDAAGVALSLLAREPDAHYAEALALCIQAPAVKRSRSEVEAILRRLAVARGLPRAGAHIDLLSALVIANYYLPKYIPPPAAPDALLRRGLEVCTRRDLSENVRVLDLEPIVIPRSPLNPNSGPPTSRNSLPAQMRLWVVKTGAARAARFFSGTSRAAWAALMRRAMAAR
jgi:hypothetical protein